MLLVVLIQMGWVVYIAFVLLFPEALASCNTSVGAQVLSQTEIPGQGWCTLSLTASFMANNKVYNATYTRDDCVFKSIMSQVYLPVCYWQQDPSYNWMPLDSRQLVSYHRPPLSALFVPFIENFVAVLILRFVYGADDAHPNDNFVRGDGAHTRDEGISLI